MRVNKKGSGIPKDHDRRGVMVCCFWERGEHKNQDTYIHARLASKLEETQLVVISPIIKTW